MPVKSSLAIAAMAMLLNALCPGSASALGPSATQGFSRRCPFQLTVQSDGCSLSYSAATTRIPTFFTGYASASVVGGTNRLATTVSVGYAAQSGQGSYKVRPAWNVAGVDYPVGYFTPLDKLIDVRASPPAGCSLRNFGPSVGLQCTGSGALAISGYRFDLHGGTWLIINSPNYTSATITNSYFLNGPVSDRNGGSLIIVSNLGGDLIVTNSTLDGNGRVMTAGLAYLIADNRRGGPQRDIIQQNAFFRIPQKGIGTGPCGDTFIQQNYFEEMEISPQHQEFTIDGATACVKDNLVESYNTMLMTSGLVRTGNGGTAALMFLSGGNNLRSWNTVIASHNTLISNTIGNPSVYPGVGAATTSRIIEESGGAVYKEIDYSYNFIDATGSLLCYYVPTPTPAKTVMFGNTNLLTGLPIDDFSSTSCAGHHR